MSIQDQMPQIPDADGPRDVHQERVKAELDKLNARINEFKAKAEHSKAEAAVSYNNAVEELVAKRDALEAKWQEVQDSGEAAWQDVYKGFESAWGELVQAFDTASKRFE
jgi:uncharacterized protein YukE